jgi:hypothetical protein
MKLTQSIRHALFLFPLASLAFVACKKQELTDESGGSDTSSAYVVEGDKVTTLQLVTFSKAASEEEAANATDGEHCWYPLTYTNEEFKKMSAQEGADPTVEIMSKNAAPLNKFKIKYKPTESLYSPSAELILLAAKSEKNEDFSKKIKMKDVLAEIKKLGDKGKDECPLAGKLPKKEVVAPTTPQTIPNNASPSFRARARCVSDGGGFTCLHPKYWPDNGITKNVCIEGHYQNRDGTTPCKTGWCEYKCTKEERQKGGNWLSKPF